MHIKAITSAATVVESEINAVDEVIAEIESMSETHFDNGIETAITDATTSINDAGTEAVAEKVIEAEDEAADDAFADAIGDAANVEDSDTATIADAGADLTTLTVADEASAVDADSSPINDSDDFSYDKIETPAAPAAAADNDIDESEAIDETENEAEAPLITDVGDCSDDKKEATAAPVAATDDVAGESNPVAETEATAVAEAEAPPITDNENCSDDKIDENTAIAPTRMDIDDEGVVSETATVLKHVDETLNTTVETTSDDVEMETVAQTEVEVAAKTPPPITDKMDTALTASPRVEMILGCDDTNCKTESTVGEISLGGCVGDLHIKEQTNSNSLVESINTTQEFFALSQVTIKEEMDSDVFDNLLEETSLTRESINDDSTDMIFENCPWYEPLPMSIMCRCRLCNIKLAKKSFTKHLKTQMHTMFLSNSPSVLRIKEEVSNTGQVWNIFADRHPWLIADPLKPDCAYCKYCKKRLYCAYSETKRLLHENSSLHNKWKAEYYEQKNLTVDIETIKSPEKKRRTRNTSYADAAEGDNDEDVDVDGTNDNASENNANADDGDGDDANDNDDDGENGDEDGEDNDDDDDEEENSVKKSKTKPSKKKRKRGTDAWFDRYAWCQRYIKDPNFIFCTYCEKVMPISAHRHKHNKSIQHLIAESALKKKLSKLFTRSPEKAMVFAWMAASKNTPNKIICRYCRIRLKKSGFKRHDESQRHQDALAEYQEKMKMHPIAEQPRKAEVKTPTSESAAIITNACTKATILQWQKTYSWISYMNARPNYAYCQLCEVAVYMPTLKYASKHACSSNHQRQRILHRNQQNPAKTIASQKLPEKKRHLSYVWYVPQKHSNLMGKCSYCHVKVHYKDRHCHCMLRSHRIAKQQFEQAVSATPDAETPIASDCTDSKDENFSAISSSRAAQSTPMPNVERIVNEERTVDRPSPKRFKSSTKEAIEMANLLTDAHSRLLQHMRQRSNNDDNDTVPPPTSIMLFSSAASAEAIAAAKAAVAAATEKTAAAAETTAAAETPTVATTPTAATTAAGVPSSSNDFLSLIPTTNTTAVASLPQQEQQSQAPAPQSTTSAQATQNQSVSNIVMPIQAAASVNHSPSDKNNDPLSLFISSVGKTVKQMPVDLIAEWKMKVMQIVYDLEIRSLRRQQNDMNEFAGVQKYDNEEMPNTGNAAGEREREPPQQQQQQQQQTAQILNNTNSTILNNNKRIVNSNDKLIICNLKDRSPNHVTASSNTVSTNAFSYQNNNGSNGHNFVKIVAGKSTSFLNSDNIRNEPLKYPNGDVNKPSSSTFVKRYVAANVIPKGQIVPKSNVFKSPVKIHNDMNNSSGGNHNITIGQRRPTPVQSDVASISHIQINSQTNTKVIPLNTWSQAPVRRLSTNHTPERMQQTNTKTINITTRAPPQPPSAKLANSPQIYNRKFQT